MSKKCMMLCLAIFFVCVCMSTWAEVSREAEQLMLAQKWEELHQSLPVDDSATTDPVVILLKGYACLMTNDYVGATEQFSRLGGASDFAKLVDYTSALAQRNPQNTIAQMLKGDALSRSGKCDEALAALSEAVRLDQPSALIYNIRGVVWVLAGKVEDATTDFERAIELQPNFADAHCNKGLSLLRAGNLSAAIEALTTALDKAPANPIALTGRGVAHIKQRDWKAAIADFRAVTKSSPEFIPAAANLRYAKRARAEEALSDKLESDRAVMFASIKILFDDQGRLTKAVYPDGSELRYELDPRGNLAKITDSQLGTTSYQHNDLNQLTSVAYPNGRRFSFGYDQSSRLASIVYPDGERVSISYDSQRQAISVRDATKVMEQVFETSGRLTQLKTEWGAVTNFHYDAAGKLTAIRDQHGIALNDFEVRMRYLDNSRLRVVESPFGSQTSHFDAYGQLLKVEMGAGLKAFYDRLPDGGFLVTSPFGFSRFDKAGHILASMTVEGVKDTFEWNLQGRLLRSSSLFSGTTRYNWSSTGDTVTVIPPTGLIYDLRVDKSGRLESIDLFGRQFRFGYDAMGNVNRVLGTAGQTFAELKCHYDKLGRLDRITIPNWNRYSRMTDILLEFSAKNPVPSAEWLKRYDAAWSQVYPSSAPKSLDQLAAEFERWPEEVMRVQANVLGLTFLTMVAHPAAIGLDWVSKPFGLSVGHTIVKECLKALTEAGIRNLNQIPYTEDVITGFQRINQSLKFVQGISSWGSFGWKIAKAIGSSFEWRTEWRFGTPTLESSRQYTWIHENFKPHVDWSKLGTEVSKEIAKKVFNEFAVKPISRQSFSTLHGLSPDAASSVRSERGTVGTGASFSSGSVPILEHGRKESLNTRVKRHDDPGGPIFFDPPPPLPVPTEQYKLKLQQQWPQKPPPPPGGVIFLDLEDEEELDVTDVLGEGKKVPVPKEPLCPFLIFPTLLEF